MRRQAVTECRGLTRRGCLSLLGLGGAALVLDPERLLWVPGARRVFDVGGWSIGDGATTFTGNTYLTPDWIAAEALRVLAQNLTWAARVRRTYGDRITTRLEIG